MIFNNNGTAFVFVQKHFLAEGRDGATRFVMISPERIRLTVKNLTF